MFFHKDTINIGKRGLDCSDTKITSMASMASTSVNFKSLDCSDTKITSIPSTLVNQEALECSRANITLTPSTLVKLWRLYSWNMDIKSSTLVKSERIDGL